MKYITPLNVFLYFVVLGSVGVAFIEYVFWAKHNFYDIAALVIFAVFPLTGAIAAACTAYYLKQTKGN
jgi:hypothetical protein